MSWGSVQNSIYDWIKSIFTTETVVWSKQNVGQPTQPCVILDINSIQRVGDDFVSAPDDDGNLSIVGNRDFTLSVQYLGVDSLDRMEALRMATQNPVALESLQYAGIAFFSSEPVMDLTELVQNEFEERAGIDLMMRTHAETTVLAGTMGSVGVEKIFQIAGIAGTDTAVMVENIEIP